MSFFSWWRSEIIYTIKTLRILNAVKSVLGDPNKTLRNHLAQVAQAFPENSALVSEQESYTYRQLIARMNQYCRWLASENIQKADVVALFMPNRSEFVACWLGTISRGAVSAWINYSLTGASLVHSIKTSEARLLIVDASLVDEILAVQSQIGDISIVIYGGDHQKFPNLQQRLGDFSTDSLTPDETTPLTLDDPAIYVYTSGTTGLPKAAEINHSRLLRVMVGFAELTSAKSNDRIYIPLPLYHTTGGVCCLGVALTRGGCAVFPAKFSATRFWSDVIEHKCTIFGYVGELCRYLLFTPPSPLEQQHRLRCAVGNGLRKDTFEALKKRSGINDIREFYGATEGNIVIFNFDSKTGSVGRIPLLAKRRMGVKIIAFDIEKEEPIRGTDGFCIECGPDQVGEIIAEIVNDPKRPTSRFDGYRDPEASQRKILHDVFVKGDMYFLSGDLMMQDQAGYYYFQDRIGDTYRWKGENVATSEVAFHVALAPGIQETNVYGVAIPGVEGRAGMAAVTLTPGVKFDPSAVFSYISSQLPDFARPLFIRVQSAMDMTGTFKQRKIDLVKAGFNPELSPDPLYIVDPVNKTYQPLTSTIYQNLCEGKMRV